MLALPLGGAGLLDVHGGWRVRGSDVTRSARGLPPHAIETANGPDPAYPWRFLGRLWFRSALVRCDDAYASLPAHVRPLALFGWTIGGHVALEYDESPVGPYLEYVTMGALVRSCGTVGQWGSALYVSTDEAAAVCRDTWGVPARSLPIEFVEGGDRLVVDQPPDPESASPRVTLGGWATTRTSSADAPRRGALPVLWTPQARRAFSLYQRAPISPASAEYSLTRSLAHSLTHPLTRSLTHSLAHSLTHSTSHIWQLTHSLAPQIKALWAPFVSLPTATDASDQLNLHRLRLSASSLRLHWCAQVRSYPPY